MILLPSGEIYDIVAGTFLVTGLTDDSFGSLSPDLLRQFMTEFKMPEQFAKIGDRIVAIPMISEEQQKQTVLEEKSSIVNENTSGMAVDGHIGTWHTIDHKEIDGHTFWLMEHDTFGDDASCIIVDERGELVLSHIYDGFDETAVNLLRQSWCCPISMTASMKPQSICSVRRSCRSRRCRMTASASRI